MTSTIDPVSVPLVPETGMLRSSAPAEAVAGPDRFARWVVSGIDRVSEGLLEAQVDVQRLAAGEPVELHRLMLRLEESRMSFQLMLQVRNRLLEAYQDVMRMQV